MERIKRTGGMDSRALVNAIHKRNAEFAKSNDTPITYVIGGRIFTVGPEEKKSASNNPNKV